MEKNFKKVQCKVPNALLDHITKQKDFNTMNSYIKDALIEKSKYKSGAKKGPKLVIKLV